MTPLDPPSPADRRDATLRQAGIILRARRLRRTAQLVAAPVLGVAVIVAAAAIIPRLDAAREIDGRPLVVAGGGDAPTPVDTQPEAVPLDQTRAPGIEIVFVRSVDARPGAFVRSVSDEQLLALLAQTGASAGLVRVGGRAIVTDNATASPYEPPPPAPADEEDGPRSRRGPETTSVS